MPDLTVSGQRFTADADIFDALDLPNVRSLLSIDSAAARERIERLPWIATATISRIFPGSLEVHVTERKPAALWIRGQREYLIDLWEKRCHCAHVPAAIGQDTECKCAR